MGFDAVLLVEGRELAYVKLLDVDVFLSAAARTAASRPSDTQRTVAVTAGDVALRDLQASFLSREEQALETPEGSGNEGVRVSALWD